MKKVLALFCVFILCSAFQCEDEPLEGNFVTDEEISCEDAITTTAEAAQAFSDANDTNFIAICNSYKDALNAQISACGDDNGTLQAIVDQLNCVNDNTNDCETAIATKNEAETVFNASTDTDYTDNCNALKVAIQNVIDICGTTTELEAQLNGLGNCILTAGENNLIKRIIYTSVDDGTTSSTNFVYDGNNLISMIDISEDSEEFRVEYIYNNDLLVRVNNYENEILLEDSFTTFEYNSSNQLIKMDALVTDEVIREEFSYNMDGTITVRSFAGETVSELLMTSESLVTLNDGQIIKEEWVDETFETTYEYDGNNGVYKNINLIKILNLVDGDFSGFYRNGVQNNLLKEIENDNAVETVYQEYTYTYNASNYPETASYFSEGILEETLEFIYE